MNSLNDGEALNDWEILDKTFIDSPYEQVVKSGVKDIENNMKELFFQKKLIITFRCKKTGILKQSERSLFSK